MVAIFRRERDAIADEGMRQKTGASRQLDLGKIVAGFSNPLPDRFCIPQTGDAAAPQISFQYGREGPYC